MRSAAEVYRTLDKMQLRKEYHEALSGAGIDMPYIVAGLKNLVDNSTSDKIKLGGLQTILKSIGLEKYEKQEEDGKNWEELVLELSEEKSEENFIDTLKVDDYEVVAPPLPESVEKRQKEERDEADELYG